MPKTFKTFRDLSRTDWGAYYEDGEHVARVDIEYGCRLRIADAAEAMAKNWKTLVAERDWLQRQLNEEQSRNKNMWRRLNALRGAITRMKNNGQWGRA